MQRELNVKDVYESYMTINTLIYFIYMQRIAKMMRRKYKK